MPLGDFGDLFPSLACSHLLAKSRCICTLLLFKHSSDIVLVLPSLSCTRALATLESQSSRCAPSTPTLPLRPRPTSWPVARATCRCRPSARGDATIHFDLFAAVHLCAFSVHASVCVIFQPWHCGLITLNVISDCQQSLLGLYCTRAGYCVRSLGPPAAGRAARLAGPVWEKQ